MKKPLAGEQIILILQEAESREVSTKDQCKRHNITEKTLSVVQQFRRHGRSRSASAQGTGLGAWAKG